LRRGGCEEAELDPRDKAAGSSKDATADLPDSLGERQFGAELSDLRLRILIVKDRSALGKRTCFPCDDTGESDARAGDDVAGCYCGSLWLTAAALVTPGPWLIPSTIIGCTMDNAIGSL
jgi:hypothetical protein